MQSGKHSRLSQIVHNISGLHDGENEFKEGMDLHKLSLIGITNLSNSLLETHSALKTVNDNLTEILSNQMLLKKDTVKTRFEVAGTNRNDLQKMISFWKNLTWL